MAKCEEEVIAAMGGATLSPAESMLVEDLCGKGFAAFMIVDLLQAERAGAELAALMKASGFGNDEELWELAFQLLATVKDPKKALDQARAALSKERALKAKNMLRELHADNGVKPSGPGGGKPK